MLLPDAMQRDFDTLKIPFLAIATDSTASSRSSSTAAR